MYNIFLHKYFRASTLVLLRIFFTAVAVFTILALFGCRRHKSVIIPTGVEVALQDVGSDIYDLTDDTMLHNDVSGSVVIVAGYGYNNKDFIESVIDKTSTYNVTTFVFPDDFRHNGKTYITNLTGLVSNIDLKGIILLGAPPNTSVAISRLISMWGGALPYPVLNLAPLDDVSGSEATSDIVIDFNSDKTSPSSVLDILINSIRSCIYAEGSYKREPSLLQLAAMIAGDSVTPFIDSSTGLRSVNHFVLRWY